MAIRILAIPLTLVGVMLAVGAGTAAWSEPDTVTPPIIDMHLHAESLAGFLGDIADPTTQPSVCAGDQGILMPGLDPKEPITVERAKTCPHRLPAAGSEEDLLRETFELLEKYNIWAVTSGDLEQVRRWRKAAPTPARLFPAINFHIHDGDGGAVYRDLAELRRLHADGEFTVFAEVSPQYHGLSPADESLDAYFALAEELDIPVGIHMGEGPVGAPYVGSPQYRASLGRPLLLEEVMIRHPKLRLYVTHFGSPLIDETIALLYSHPQVYVDVAQNNWGFPRQEFHRQLRRLVEAGFGKRILFGSDQMIWPQTIEIAIESIESADFLSEEQKRDILYENAVRFLRLSEEDVARHHRAVEAMSGT